MKNTLLLLSAATALGMSASAARADGLVVYSEIVGHTTQVIRGGGAVSFVGIDLLESPVYEGSVSAVDAEGIVVDGMDFSLLLEDGSHYFLDVIFADKDEALGLNTSIVSWWGDALLLGDDFTGALTPGVDRVRIHRLPTIGEVFGGNGDVLTGGTAATADVIIMPNLEGSGLIHLYYSNSPMFGVGWRQMGQPGDKSNLPIYFSDGLYIHKNSPGDVSLSISGGVKATRTMVIAEEGLTPFSVVFHGGTTLGNSGLYNPANPAHSLKAGTAITADAVLLDANGDGVSEVYYYSSGGIFGSGWRQIGKGGDMSGVRIDSAFGIVRTGDPVLLIREPSY